METQDCCAQCARTDVDEHWLYLQVERISEHEDCEFDSADLSFCSEAHVADYFATGRLEFEPHDHSERTAGTRVDVLFMGCGLLAIILSIVGVTALVRWIL